MKERSPDPAATTTTPGPTTPEGVPRWGKGSQNPHEGYFLAGPHSRLAEFGQLLRIGVEFIRGFRFFHLLGPCVTVFGSARFAEDHRYYALAREAGRLLAEAGFTVLTGGGPGIMEAANRGAREAGGPRSAATSRSPPSRSPTRTSTASSSSATSSCAR